MIKNYEIEVIVLGVITEIVDSTGVDALQAIERVAKKFNPSINYMAREVERAENE